MLKNCKYCDIEFNAFNSKSKFCSRKCSSNSQKVRHKIKCLNCNIIFETVYKKRKFCCHSCATIFNGKNGKCGGDNTSLKRKIEIYGNNLGKKKYKENLDKLSKKMKGKTSKLKGRKLSEEHKKKVLVSLKKATEKRKGKTFDEIYGEGSSKKLSDKMKGTFSKEWFLNKYGNEKGISLYNKRIKNIKNTTHFKKYNKINKQNYSKISQELFWNIHKLIKNKYKDIYFAELNHEYGCETNKNFDFVIKDNKKIIEFNGDKFHANPNIYKDNDVPISFMNIKAKNIWENDNIKINKAKATGYNCLIVWEKNYLNDKEKILFNCLEFING